MNQPDFTEAPHRRYNPLKGEWVLVSPHRNKRPWQGRTEEAAPDNKPPHDPNCYLCAGNTRVNGEVNPDYEGPFVFNNDFPAMLSDTPQGTSGNEFLFRAETVRGTARVICFSERHDLTLPELPITGIRRVIDLWSDQLEELGKTYVWVALFENKGAIMGCSNPHPHGQIWASDFIPNEVTCEDSYQRQHLRATGRNAIVENEKPLGAELKDIMAACQRNNPPFGVSGALLYNETFFAQVLEGDRKAVTQTFCRISADSRHSDLVILEARPIDQRRFAAWSMGFVGAPVAEEVHRRYCTSNQFNPAKMTADSLLGFMVELTENVPQMAQSDKAAQVVAPPREAAELVS